MTLSGAFSAMSYVLFLVFFVYFIALTLFYILLAVIGLVEGMRRSRQSEEENYPLIFLSTVTIPVSIVIPAHNEEDWIEDCLSSVLALNYPKFEVIIVDDESTDKTFEIINKLVGMRPIDMPYIKHYRDGKVRSIYKGIKHPNVTVIRKFAGVKKAGAVNAGLNLASYDYVCSMDADTVLEPDALIKIMAQVEKDPDRIIGIGSYFSLVNGLKVKKGRVVEKSFSYNPIVAYQNMEYIRSFIGNRIAWSKYNAMPIVAGGFSIWRKDVLYELGGFSAEFTCEDIEFTFRAHDYIAKNKEKGYRILMLPYHVGWTEGPSDVVSLISQRERWQRVTDETIWHYKYMFCNPRFGGFAFLALPYFVIYEVLGVFFEVTSIILVAAGWIAGILDVKTFLAFVALMVITQSFVSLLSIFSFTRTHRLFSVSYTCYMIFLSFLESFSYRWINAAAKILGTFRFMKGVKTHDKYKREKRS